MQPADDQTLGACTQLARRGPSHVFLDQSDRAQAVVAAYEGGLVRVGETGEATTLA